MASVSTYLTLVGKTEKAFIFYDEVFSSDFFKNGGYFIRVGDIPRRPDQPPLSEKEKNLVFHISMPILGGHSLKGSDVPEAIGADKIVEGNSVYINLEPDTREETDRLFAALSKAGHVDMSLQEMPWGEYLGACTDQFGVHWMFWCA